MPFFETLWPSLLECLHTVCRYKNVTLLNLSLSAPLSVLPPPSPTEWKKRPEGGHLYLLPLFLVLAVQPVGHLVTWNQVSKGVIAQIDVKGCTSNGEASFLPHFALFLTDSKHAAGELLALRAGGGEVCWGVSRVTCKHFFLVLLCPSHALQAEHRSRTWRSGCG